MVIPSSFEIHFDMVIPSILSTRIYFSSYKDLYFNYLKIAEKVLGLEYSFMISGVIQLFFPSYDVWSNCINAGYLLEVHSSNKW